MGRKAALVLGVMGLVLTLGLAVSGVDWPACTSCSSSNLKVLEAEIVETQSCTSDKRTGNVRVKLDTNQTYSVRVVGEVFYSGTSTSVASVSWCTQSFSATAFVTVLSGLQWDCDKGLDLKNVLVGWDSADLCGSTPDCSVIEPFCNDDDYGTTFAIAGSEPDLPVVSDIPDQTIAEGSAFATINLDDYVDDADNIDAEITWTYSGNTELSVTIDGSRVATIGIPDANWNGAETITFTATDPDLLSDNDAATFTVTAVNDIPTGSDSFVTTNENTPYALLVSDLGYSDADSDPLAQIQITSLETVGSMQLSAADVTLNQVVTAAQLNAGDLTYTPLLNESGTPYDTFRFKVHDGTVYSASDNQMTVNVTDVNDPPTAMDDEVSTPERTSVIVDVVANDTDPDGDALQVVSVTVPSRGSATITGNQVVYTPPFGFVGDATFSYTIRDSGGQTATGAVTVTVSLTNSPPRADAGGLYRGMVGEIIVLDASFSTDPDIRDLLQYRWDVTGDGTYNTDWLDVPQYEMTFGMAYQGSVKLEVRDLRNGIPNETNSTDEAIIIIEALTSTLPIGDHLFEFLGVVYNDDGTSTWTYRVTSGGGPSLSH
ncbi:MAG: Ig-like domain-containing protein, partial [Candidatus Bipolaricaulota bacterium]